MQKKDVKAILISSQAEVIVEDAINQMVEQRNGASTRGDGGHTGEKRT